MFQSTLKGCSEGFLCLNDTFSTCWDCKDIKRNWKGYRGIFLSHNKKTTFTERSTVCYKTCYKVLFFYMFIFVFIVYSCICFPKLHPIPFIFNHQKSFFTITLFVLCFHLQIWDLFSQTFFHFLCVSLTDKLCKHTGDSNIIQPLCCLSNEIPYAWPDRWEGGGRKQKLLYSLYGNKYRTSRAYELLFY